MREAREVETLVYRTVSFEVSAFDKLKAWQRALEAEKGRALTNSEVIAELFRSIPAPPSGH